MGRSLLGWRSCVEQWPRYRACASDLQEWEGTGGPGSRWFGSVHYRPEDPGARPGRVVRSYGKSCWYSLLFPLMRRSTFSADEAPGVAFPPVQREVES